MNLASVYFHLFHRRCWNVSQKIVLELWKTRENSPRCNVHSTQKCPPLGFEPGTLLLWDNLDSCTTTPSLGLVDSSSSLNSLVVVVLQIEDIYFTSRNEINNPSSCPLTLAPSLSPLFFSSTHYPDQYALSPKNRRQASCEEMPASVGPTHVNLQTGIPHQLGRGSLLESFNQRARLSPTLVTMVTNGRGGSRGWMEHRGRARTQRWGNPKGAMCAE